MTISDSKQTKQQLIAKSTTATSSTSWRRRSHEWRTNSKEIIRDQKIHTLLPCLWIFLFSFANYRSSISLFH